MPNKSKELSNISVNNELDLKVVSKKEYDKLKRENEFLKDINLIQQDMLKKDEKKFEEIYKRFKIIRMLCP